MASWFSEGTVTVQNGSPTVTGVGTKFSNCRSGDMFVGPDQGIYQVINPASDTSLSISPAYRGAAVGGAGYGIVPVNGYPKALADAVNQMVQQWGATLAGLGDVSAQDIVPVTMGGTGATSAPGARTTLGLGTAATLNAGSVTGNLMLIGDRASPLASTINTWGNSLQIWNNTTGGYPEANQSGTIINTAWPDGNYGAQILMSFSSKMFFRSGSYATAPMLEVYHTGNTTRGSGGALSAASPIMRIACVTTSERRDLQEETFMPAGEWGVSNEEARGVTVQRIGVGEYRITGSLGLALEGWRTQDPCSPDGGRTLGVTESSQDEDGSIVIRLFRRRWTLAEDGEMVPGRGAPIDVPLNSWIDVRLEMPKIETPPPPTITEE